MNTVLKYKKTLMKQIQVNTRITNRDSKLIDYYFNEISKYQPLSKEDETETARRIREDKDDVARNKLIRANLKFAVTVAKHYQNTGASLSDLINDANVGLIKASHKFDERTGNKFISYAVWWIKQSVLESINKTGRPIRLPSNRFLDLNKVNRFSDKFLKDNGREPIKQEICDHLDMSSHDYDFIKNADNPIMSISKPFSDDDSSTLEETLKSEEYGNVENNILEISRQEAVQRIFEALPERESDALKVDFGFGGSYESVAEKHGISQERVRQLKKKALMILRSKPGIKKLQELL